MHRRHGWRHGAHVLALLYCVVVALVAAREAMTLTLAARTRAVADGSGGGDDSDVNVDGRDQQATWPPLLQLLLTVATTTYAVVHAALVCVLLWWLRRTATSRSDTHTALRNVAYAVLLSCALTHVLCVTGSVVVHRLETRMPLLSQRLAQHVLPPSSSSAARGGGQCGVAATTTATNTAPAAAGTEALRRAHDDDHHVIDDVFASRADETRALSSSSSSSLSMHDYWQVTRMAMQTAWQVALVLLAPSSSLSASQQLRDDDDNDNNDAFVTATLSRLLSRPLWLLSVCGLLVGAVAAAADSNDSNDNNDNNSSHVIATTTTRHSSTRDSDGMTSTRTTQSCAASDGKKAQ